MTMDDRARFRASIRRLIRETDAGMPGYGADVGALTSQGYGFMNYGGSLKNIFIDPFIDVFKTAKGVATELTTRAKTATQVLVETVLSSFIPLYETNYATIFKQMDKSLGEVKKKYEKVYQANDEAFKNKDIRFLAFLYDPTAWVTAKVVESSPDVARSVLEIFTDGNTGAVTHLMEAIRYLKELEMEVKNVSRYNRAVPQRLRKQAHTNRHIMPWESKLRNLKKPILESEEPTKNPSQRIQQLLSNPELKKEIAASPVAQEMKIDGQKILSTLMSQLSKDVAEVKAIDSLDDIQRMSQGKVKLPTMGQMNPQEKQQAEQAAVSSVKQGLSEFYKRSLQGAVNQAQSEGVANDNAYVRALQSLLSKIGS